LSPSYSAPSITLYLTFPSSKLNINKLGHSVVAKLRRTWQIKKPFIQSWSAPSKTLKYKISAYFILKNIKKTTIFLFAELWTCP
jgi:hypothetical protein